MDNSMNAPINCRIFNSMKDNADTINAKIKPYVNQLSDIRFVNLLKNNLRYKDGNPRRGK